MTELHYCIECGKNLVHSEGNTCDICYASLYEDESLYVEPKIGVYKFKP